MPETEPNKQGEKRESGDKRRGKEKEHEKEDYQGSRGGAVGSFIQWKRSKDSHHFRLFLILLNLFLSLLGPYLYVCV